MKKSILYTIVAQVVSFLFLFLSSIFITRLLGAEGRGVYAFIFANAKLFTMIFGLNLAGTLTYFISKEQGKIGKVVGVGALFCLLGIALFCIIIYGIYFSEFSLINFILPNEYNSFYYLLFFAVIFFGMSINNFVTGFFQGRTNFKKLGIMVVASSLIILLSYVGFFYYSEFNNITFSIKEAVLVVLITHLALVLTRLIFFASDVDFKIRFDSLGNLKPFLNYAGLGTFAIFLNFLNKRIDLWFIEYYKSIEELGYYSISVLLSGLLISVIAPINKVTRPYITKASQEKGVRILGLFSRLSFTGVLLMVLVLLPLSVFFIPFIYGQAFSESIIPFQILSVGILFLIIGNNFNNYNFANNKVKINVNANILALVVTITMDFLLIPKYGIIGASLASVAAYFTAMLYLIITTNRLLGKTSVSIFF